MISYTIKFQCDFPDCSVIYETDIIRCQIGQECAKSYIDKQTIYEVPLGWQLMVPEYALYCSKHRL